MNFRQEKELEKRWLVLLPDKTLPEVGQAGIDTGSYTLQMALRACIPGLLPLSVVFRDGQELLRADITGCGSVASRYSVSQLSGKDLRTLLYAFRAVVSALPKYLLDPSDLVLNPEYIWYGPQSDEVLFLYIPQSSAEDAHSVRLLAQFLLKRIDHGDPLAVDLAYTFFDQVSRENCSLADVLGKILLRRRDAPAAEGGPVSGTSGGPVPGTAGGLFPPQGRTGSPASRYGPALQRRSAAQEGPVIRKQPPVHDRTVRQRKSGRRFRGNQRHNAPDRSGLIRTLLVPGTVIFAAAVILVILFHMDRTQIGGMAFLCAALLWMVHNSLVQRSSGLRNLWADEDVEDDEDEEEFYRALLREAQAAEAASGNPGRQAQDRWDPGRQAQDRWDPDRWDGSPSVPGSGQRQSMEPSASVDRGPALVSLNPEQYPDIPLTGPGVVLGKDPGKADIPLSRDTISRAHARVELRSDGWYVTDLFSTNGTFLNGKRLREGQAALLSDGANLALADAVWRFAASA